MRSPFIKSTVVSDAPDVRGGGKGTPARERFISIVKNEHLFDIIIRRFAAFVKQKFFQFLPGQPSGDRRVHLVANRTNKRPIPYIVCKNNPYTKTPGKVYERKNKGGKTSEKSVDKGKKR